MFAEDSFKWQLFCSMTGATPLVACRIFDQDAEGSNITLSGVNVLVIIVLMRGSSLIDMCNMVFGIQDIYRNLATIMFNF